MSAGSEDDLRAAWEPAPDVQRCPWAGRRKPSLGLFSRDVTHS